MHDVVGRFDSNVEAMRRLPPMVIAIIAIHITIYADMSREKLANARRRRQRAHRAWRYRHRHDTCSDLRCFISK